jgi:hypothetical protein
LGDLKMQIELPYPMVCEIVTQDLHQNLTNLQIEYESRKNGNIPAGVFSADLKTDLKKIRKTIRAIHRILDYYGQT